VARSDSFVSSRLLPEAARLAELEAVVESGLQTFVAVGQALMEIRDARLYRESHETFEVYCRDRWGWTARRSNQLIAAAEVGNMLPVANARQAAELAPLRDEPERMRDAWQEASSNGEPTALKVREAVQRVLPPVSEEAREKQRRWAATTNVLDGLAHFDRPAIAEQAEVEAALLDSSIAATRGQEITPERLRSAAAWLALLADSLERRST